MRTIDVRHRARPGAEPKPLAGWAGVLGGKSNGDPPDPFRLLVGFAHDLRSPLTSILFLAEALQRGRSGPVNETQSRELGIIYTAALEMVCMANDVVDLALGCRRLAERAPEPFSVSGLLASVRDIVRPMAEKKRLDLRCRTAGVDSRLGYPVAISRILLNLTANAVRFTEKGYVELGARPSRAGRLEFCVRDTGVGIDPGFLRSLAARRHPRGNEGHHLRAAGLGLSICCELLGAMGSELRVQTQPGRGSRFSFELELPPIG